MKKLTLVSWCMLLIIAVCSSSGYSFIYDIDEFTQFNGTNTFNDTFSDGAEPPWGPISGSDYKILGAFDTNRESGGLLELNSSDAVVDTNEIFIDVALDDSTYFLTDGSGGDVTGSFEVNDGFGNDEEFGIAIGNYFNSGPPPLAEDEAYVGISVDSAGNIYADWGDWDNDYNQDITSALGSNKNITVKLSVNTLNQVTATWDYGSDGSIDLTKTNFMTLAFTSGDYTGAFGVSSLVSPEDLIVDFGDSIGLWIRNNDGSWEKLHSSSAEIIATGDIDGSGEDDVIIDFGSGVGIWVKYNNSTWSKLHSSSPEIMTTEDIDGDNDGKDDVIIDFGPGIGIYVYYNNTTWSKLHSSSAEIIAIGDMDGNHQEDVIIDFGPGVGIWVYYNDTTWSKLHSLSPEIMTTEDIDGDNDGKDDVIIDFGPGLGIYVYYNNTTWSKLHNSSCESITSGKMN
jgi:hypothetical protein